VREKTIDAGAMEGHRFSLFTGGVEIRRFKSRWDRKREKQPPNDGWDEDTGGIARIVTEGEGAP